MTGAVPTTPNVTGAICCHMPSGHTMPKCAPAPGTTATPNAGPDNVAGKLNIFTLSEHAN